MTDLRADITDIAGGRRNGTATITSTALRPSASQGVAIAPVVTHEVKVTAGVFEMKGLDPGPAEIEVWIGAWRQSWLVVIPDSATPVDLLDLVQQFEELPPPLVSQAWKAAEAARQARAEVDAFINLIATQLMPEMGNYQRLAEQAAIAAQGYAQNAYEAVPPASATQLGKIKIAGDLAGSAEYPRVPRLEELGDQMSMKADLDETGQLVQHQVPSIAIVNHLGAVNTEAEMLALIGHRGDWCIRRDRGTVWVLSKDVPAQLSSWVEWVYPASPVASVNGRKGAIELAAADIRDSSALGRGLMKAADASEARALLDAAPQTYVDALAETIDAYFAALNLREAGRWSATTGYNVGQVVSYNHSIYYCREAHPASSTFPASKFVRTGADIVFASTDPGNGQAWVKI